MIESVGLAREASVDRTCKTALTKARKAAKKLGRKAAKLAKKECAEPLATAAALGDAGDFAQAGFRALVKNKPVRSASCPSARLRTP